jgi:hypothetical protein
LECDRAACPCHRATSKGRGLTHCPVHGLGGKPDLNVTPHEEKGALVHCHVCGEDGQDAVIEALKARGLWDGAGESPRPSQAKRDPDHVYTYTDAAGAPLYRKLRWDGPDGKRERMAFEHLSGDRWLSGQNGIAPVLYRLRELAGYAPGKSVFIVEGEKCADTLTDLIVRATTSGNAGSWQPEFAPHFKGQNVVILPDNDEPGRKHGREVAESLDGIAKSVRVVDLPDLPVKGDVVDWLANGGSREKLRDLVQATKPGGATSETYSLEGIEPEPMTWIWKHRVARAGLTILDGEGGVGKSTFGYDLAARITTGRDMPDGSPGVLGDVLIVTKEDFVKSVIVPRLMVAKADLSRVHMFKTETGLLSFPDDVPRVRREVRLHGIVLVIVDPIVAYMGLDHDSHKAQDVRRALTELGEVGEQEECGILAYRHPSRAGAKSKSGTEYGGGSKAFIELARSGLAILPDPDDKGLLILCTSKTNFKEGQSMQFRIVDASFQSPKGLIEVARVVWDGFSGQTFKTLTATLSKVDQAKAFLVALLAKGPVQTGKIEADAERQGISEWALKQAKEMLGVVAERVGLSYWQWRLPLPSEGEEK